MPEIPVRYYELAIPLQNVGYLSKFPRLSVSDVFENPLGQDNVESFVTELYRGFPEVSLEQVRGRTLYGYVNAVVVYVCRKQATGQVSGSRGVACRAAANPCGGDRADQGQERSCWQSE